MTKHLSRVYNTRIAEVEPCGGSTDYRSLEVTSVVLQDFTDLKEALAYAVEGGYRIYGADIQVAIGLAYLANCEKEKARQSTQRALQMSQEMGYHWGKVDAEEVLETIAQMHNKIQRQRAFKHRCGSQLLSQRRHPAYGAEKFSEVSTRTKKP